ncbi:hypothetical protein [Glycocaulis sp.]|uniref:hypothetical protein n=1 Tax=Glycocaulis sp. TaxID=1969725 RepID=UPI003F723FD3
MRSSQDEAVGVRHPIRATGTLAFLLLLVTIGVFIAFMFALTRGQPGVLTLAILGGAVLVSFALWVRENHIASSAANAPAIPRRELKAAWLVPVQSGIVMAYVAALMASFLYAPGLTGFQSGVLQSLPIAFAAGWVALWIYNIVESDEMVRRMMITATAISAGAVLCLATFWGLIAVHRGLPEFSSIFLFPAFAMIYGFAAMFLTSRHS